MPPVATPTSCNLELQIANEFSNFDSTRKTFPTFHFTSCKLSAGALLPLLSLPPTSSPSFDYIPRHSPKQRRQQDTMGLGISRQVQPDVSAERVRNDAPNIDTELTLHSQTRPTKNTAATTQTRASCHHAACARFDAVAQRSSLRT